MMETNNRTIHANMVIIDGIGTLIKGAANLGKSELSLSLIDRGHKLVSDDATELYLENDTLMGKCPESINCFMQIDYLGVINVAKIFGEKATCPQHQIHLCVELQTKAGMANLDEPLQPIITTETLLDQEITHYQIPTEAKSQLLALLIEVLVRNYKLQLEGYDAFSDLHQNQHTLLQRSSRCREND